MISLDYEKRKNTAFFKSLQQFSTTEMNQIQNYVPIYNRFFKLNNTNYNSINLNHTVFVDKVLHYNEYNSSYLTLLKHSVSGEELTQHVFFKYAPLVDPYKFLIGKITTPLIYNIPQLQSTEKDSFSKLLCENNSAYIDGFFCFLTSRLIYTHKFLHGIDFYGMFNGLKKNFKVNIADDLEFLCKSDYFNKHKNVAFQVEDYEGYLTDAEEGKEGKEKEPRLKKLQFQTRQTNHSVFSLDSFPNEILDDFFVETLHTENQEKEQDLELDPEIEITDHQITSLKSSSTCSTRTSLTSYNEENDEDPEFNGSAKATETDADADASLCSGSQSGSGSGSGTEWETDQDSNEEDEEDDDDDTVIEATIPNYPVNVICMEHCECTLDKWIYDSEEEISEDEWFAALFQIIMILITYQKAFSFTHNDLHSNNIMFNKTEHKYLYYVYKKKTYKVPTYGKLFKIIDFGRAIFKFKGQLFCSDAFEQGADASAQYNCEPYFNENKPRLDPNPSFDLCRLACSLFDYLIDDMDEVKDIQSCSPLVRLIVEWCTDDNGLNVLYKRDGTERYPDFKLYKMIAKCVKKHVPHAQLERPEFAQFSITKKVFEKDEKKAALFVMNIDNIPSYVV